MSACRLSQGLDDRRCLVLARRPEERDRWQNSHMATVLESIRALLTREAVGFRELKHEATRTSEESALARGEPLEIGGKALLMKADDGYALFVISAARRIDSAP